MTHDELLAIVKEESNFDSSANSRALLAAVELHRRDVRNQCDLCTWITNGGGVMYPCPTIQAIEKELG